MPLYAGAPTDGAEADPAGLADVVAAGTVPYRVTGDGIEIALVHRPRYDDWSLPKGHQDPGEHLTLTALRETCEEARLGCRLGGRIGYSTYTVPGRGRKVVHYWAAEAVTDHGFVPTDETDALRWETPADAAALVEHDHDRTLISRLAGAGVPTSTVVLVRHAKAGSRSAWDGDDDRRPLSGTGHSQAERLATFLPRFGPDQAHSAPPLRCVQTIAPMLEHGGLGEPVDEPLLAERGYWADPDAGRARFRELATRPGVTLVCSQGGVIPDVVGQLLEKAGAPSDVPAHKASTWLLGLDAAGDPLFADYYRHPPA